MRKQIIKSMVILLTFAFCFFNLLYFSGASKKVSAGASKNYVLSGISVSGNSLNLGDFMTDGGIYVKNSKIRFDKTKVKNSAYVVAATKVNNLYECGVKKLFTADMKMNISEFASDEKAKIEIVFGMNSVRNIGDGRDCIKLILSKNTQNNKTDLSIIEVFSDGEKEPHSVLETSYVPLIEYGKDFSLHVEANTDNSITIKIDDNYIIKNYRTKIDLTGYFAIYSQGKNDFSVWNTEFLAYKYIVSKNVDYLEKFDNGEYNSNVFYSSALALDYTPCKLSVDKDGRLEFLNTYEAYISTKYKYSNYILEFDLIDLVKKDILNEDKEIIKPMTGRIGIGSGENYKGTIPEFEHNDIWLLLWGNRPAGPIFKLLDHFEDRKYQSMSNFNLWDEEFIDGRTVNVKYTSLDGVVRLFLKFDGDFDPAYPGQEKYYQYENYFECDTGKSEEGHVKIFSYGNANYKIDNLSIKNTDYIGVRQSIDADTVGFKSNIVQKTPDYQYSDKTDKNDLLANQLENGEKIEVKSAGQNCNSSIGASGLWFLVPICFGISLLRRKR